MPVYVATKTLNAIEDALRADQGASFRRWQGIVLPHIKDAYRADEDGGFRQHLGASILGTKCARAIFYGWRWAHKPHFNGKTLRLFNRGHLEEGRLIALLLMIGVQVYQQDEVGKQFKISFANGHGGGSGDGKLVGIPDIPKDKFCLFEAKTHGEKSFIKLAGVAVEENGYFVYKYPLGVKEAKPEHYVQMVTYMNKMNIDYALYTAVNKNTDHLYMEIVPRDDMTAEKFLDRGLKIVYVDQPPPQINNSITSYDCIWCDHKLICHRHALPSVNCRTCMYSKPSEKDKTWFCNKHSATIPEDVMQVGCSTYQVADYYGK